LRPNVMLPGPCSSTSSLTKPNHAMGVTGERIESRRLRVEFFAIREIIQITGAPVLNRIQSPGLMTIKGCQNVVLVSSPICEASSMMRSNPSGAVFIATSDKKPRIRLLPSILEHALGKKFFGSLRSIPTIHRVGK